MASEQPIGVYDSGIGGLTVLKSLLSALPDESFVYLGDTARVPYGNKSPQTIRRYAFESVLFLLEHRVKAIVVACNTVSASCLDLLQNFFKIPVFGVIEPAATAALAVTRNRKVGVIGTAGTVASQAYQKALIAGGAQVEARACPLLVPLAEEGWTHHPATRLVLGEYLDPLLASGIDSLILGCTHYPVLKGAIAEYAGSGVSLVESGPSTARKVKQVLEEERIFAPPGQRRQVHYYLTDVQPAFRRVGEVFLEQPIEDLRIVSS